MSVWGAQLKGTIMLKLIGFAIVALLAAREVVGDRNPEVPKTLTDVNGVTLSEFLRRRDMAEANLTATQRARLVWLETALSDPDVGHFYNRLQRAAMREELEHLQLLRGGIVSALKPENVK